MYKLIKQNARLLIVQNQVDPPTRAQAVNGHGVSRNTHITHAPPDADDGVDVFMGLLDAGVGIAGHIGQGFEGIFRHGTSYESALCNGPG